MQKTVVILLGPSGAGKGTQAARLSTGLEIPAISTGDILRRECCSGSHLGRELETCLRSGSLVSDELMNKVVLSRLAHSDCRRGFILDGYPRTVSQARYLDGVLAQLDVRQRTVFDFAVSVEQLIERLEHRRQCSACGRIYGTESFAGAPNAVCENDGSLLITRNDDQPVAIRERMRHYQANSGELVRYYRSSEYHRIPAGRKPDEIARELFELLAGETVMRGAHVSALSCAQAAC